MAVTIDVDYAVLDRAKASWDVAADGLEAASLRLGKVTGCGLSGPVAAEVCRFARRWHTEVRALATQAEGNADAFVYTKGTYEISDLAQAQRIRGLLPWAERDDAIRQV